MICNTITGIGNWPLLTTTVDPLITVSTSGFASVPPTAQATKPKENHFDIAPHGYTVTFDDNDTRFCVMPFIQYVEVKHDRVVVVTFSDNTSEKAVLNSEDTFSLEYGISICVAKKLISMKFPNHKGVGSSIYNKIVKDGMTVYDGIQKEEQELLAEKKERERIVANRRAKQQKRREKRAAAEREKQIEIQKEAYLRALKEFHAGDEAHG